MKKEQIVTLNVTSFTNIKQFLQRNYKIINQNLNKINYFQVNKVFQ